MVVKIFRLVLFFMLIFITGCVKETYDMNKLSKNNHFAPNFAISAINGDVSLGDMVKTADSVFIDQDKFVRIIFHKDSVINLKLADLYDLTNMVSFSQSYTIGELSLAPFQSNLPLTLNQITLSFISTTLRNQFVALDDGANHPFPSFPSTNLGEKIFTAFPNFQNATFASGFLEISVTNNLTAPLDQINVNLYNTTGHTFIGALTIPASQPGQTQSSSINLTNKSITNSITAAIVLSGSPGNTTPVKISLANSGIQLAIKGRDLKVKSGRIIVPVQTISSLDNKDTINFNPGSGIELDELKVKTAGAAYKLQSSAQISASLNITLPTALRNGVELTEQINIAGATQVNGSISFNNTFVDLGTLAVQPFNKVPFTYSISVNSNNTFITFNSTDKVQFELKLLNPDFDYVKGYFGQMTETLEPETFDLGIDDILNSITGEFLLSSPSIKLNYSNSFGIPIKVDFKAAGIRGTKTVNLDLLPFDVLYPVYPAKRDISSFIDINKTNSKLPEIISMLPAKINFSGSAKMNPLVNNGLRDNYVFGNSRFLGSVEIEVPMEFRMNNLQFADTIDNFMSDDSNESPLNFENFNLFRFDLSAKNGFPLGVSFSISLYDSGTDKIMKTIDAKELLGAAPVGSDGKVTGTKDTKTSIELTKDFFSSVNKADKIIFHFTLNTSGGATNVVKFYSTYKIDFKLALVARPDFEL